MDLLDHLFKKSPDYSTNCNKNKSLFKEEENNAFPDFREDSCFMLTSINYLIINMSNQLLSSSRKTMPNLREDHCLTFVNVHKTSLLSKSTLRQVQTTAIFKSFNELMKQ